MIDKRAASVPCAHCSAAQGRSACPGCGRLVCMACGQDFDTCPDPRPTQLTVGGRALGVDRLGRRLLYTTLRGRCAHLDLVTGRKGLRPALRSRAGERIEAGLHRASWLCSLGSGTLLQIIRAVDGSQLKLREHKAGWGDRSLLFSQEQLSGHGLCAIPRRSDVWLLASDLEAHAVVMLLHVAIIVSMEGFDPGFAHASGAITAAAAYDGGPLALGAPGRVSLFDLQYQTPLGQVTIPGLPVWLGLTHDELVLLVRSTAGRVQLMRVSREGKFPPLDDSWRDRPVELPADVYAPAHASVTRDGRELAVAGEGAEVLVLDLSGRIRQRLPVGPGRVDLVRFVDQDRRLVAASQGGQVTVWHRRGGRLLV